MSTIGTILRMVVINCKIPDVKIPKELIQDKNQIVASPTPMAK